MQRSPAFLFASDGEARDFGLWINENLEEVRAVAQGTTGQNMTSKATNAACQWITSVYPHSADYMLSGNIDTDKNTHR